MSFKLVELDSNKFIQKINFENIPCQFRGLCKKYISTLISIKSYSDKYINTDIIKSLEIFFNYISTTYPNWTDIKLLNRLHMEFFLHDFNNKYGHLEQKDRVYLQCIRRFLIHINIFCFEEAPIIDVDILLNEDDIPKKYNKQRESKTIPKLVMNQLDDNLHYIKNDIHRDIIFIARHTGIAISDILRIDANRCLEKYDGRYYLLLNIKNSNKQEHKIPVNKDVGELIEARIKIYKDSNKKGVFLFLENENITTSHVIKSLNQMAKERAIKQEDKIFKFTSHMLRETKAIELIDSGMDTIYVKELLGYSDTSTLERYKEDNINSMVIEWKNSSKYIENKKNTEQKLDDILNLVEDGTCKSTKFKDCYKELFPCLSCASFYVTIEFIEEYRRELQRVIKFIEENKSNKNCINIEEYYKIKHIMEEILSKLEEKLEN